jgi:type I restriction enzyme M protein
LIENIETVEKRLWRVADMLRANSDFASNEYFLPVMGLIFVRHAYIRLAKMNLAVHRLEGRISPCYQR